MEMLRNQFKRQLAEPGVQYGGWCSLADSVAAEIMAGAGFDFMVIDGEHSPNHLRSSLTQLQATNGYSVSVAARPVIGETALIKQYLDIGFQTLVVPMVESAEQAEMLVKATRYPPAGVRGVATARASRWGRMEDYWEQINDEVCLVAQIETVDGVANTEAIAAVEGVDALFVGPSDLGAALGFLGQATDPEARGKVAEAIGRAAATGKPVGTLSVNPELAREYRDAGASFVVTCVDTNLLARATTEAANLLR